MWSLYEPVHAITYFAPQARQAFEAAGLRGFWRAYFAGRSAPLGAVGAAPVIAAFYGFAPSMVTRALPDVWTLVTPQAALEARRSGARQVLAGAAEGLEGVEEAAALLKRAAQETELYGRVLGAANAALPWPEDPLDVLWQAATVLREHRGDGHVAALLVEGIEGCESMVWRIAVNEGRGREMGQTGRGWSDEEWDAARRRLRQRGFLDGEGGATEKAISAYRTIEEITDQLAARPWQALGPGATERCAQLLRPIAARVFEVLPYYPNWIGLPTPARDAS
ncbi:hypothetical protein [Dactylosporangium sp. NPDC048998]|uniref:SCO6745 family protein n=1 Tax=Dactylosporangium sp. NPDC048998 TaxID=3363976 RepID=UPI003721003F